METKTAEKATTHSEADWQAAKAKHEKVYRAYQKEKINRPDVDLSNLEAQRKAYESDDRSDALYQAMTAPDPSLVEFGGKKGK